MTSAHTRRTGYQVLLCCLVAYSLLVLTLDVQSIWWDEGISLHLAGLPWQEIIDDRASNIHPPLYFFLLKLWTGVVGDTSFAARYLSALATTLLPVVAFRFIRDRIGARSGRTVACLLAFAPPFIVYGQETRAYSLLPLGVIALWSLVWPGRRSRHPAQSRNPHEPLLAGAKLGLVQAALGLTHYAGVVAAWVVALGYAWRWMRERRAGKLHAAVILARDWLIGAALTAGAVLPWCVLVLSRGWVGLTRQAGLSNILSAPAPAGYVAALNAIFHTSGLPEALGLPHLIRPATGIGTLLALAAGMALWRSQRRRAVGSLIALWLAPFAAAPVIWWLSPQSHPRYLYAFILGGWLLTGVVISCRQLPRILCLSLLAFVLANNLLGLQTYFTDPGVARSDVRAAANYIREVAEPGDVALVPDTDWSLASYDIGMASLQMVPDDMADAAGRTNLDLGVVGSRVYALDYERGALDPRGAVRAALTWGGPLVERKQFQGVGLESYQVWRTPEVPDCRGVAPVCVTGTGLCVTGVALPSDPISGGAVPVALCWRKSEGDLRRYTVAVRLYGPSGDYITGDNDLLLDATGQPTDQWASQSTASYHLLPLPVGALPMAHTVELRLYDVLGPEQPVLLEGPELSGPAPAAVIAQVAPATSPWLTVSSYVLPEPPGGLDVSLGPALSLVGARLDREVVRPGETFYVTLHWALHQGSVSAEMSPQVALVHDDHTTIVVDSAIESLALPPGRPTLETLAVQVPPVAPSAEAEVLLRSKGVSERIGKISIASSEHLFETPQLDYAVEASAGDVAALLGFDLMPGTDVRAGEPLTVTLVWRALTGAAEQDLKVFLHLVGEDGQLVAQDDAKPAGWSRPTSGWLRDEVIVDQHVLRWQETAVSGSARLMVGFYDEATAERQDWSTGDDAYILPVTLEIMPPE